MTMINDDDVDGTNIVKGGRTFSELLSVGKVYFPFIEAPLV